MPYPLPTLCGLFLSLVIPLFMFKLIISEKQSVVEKVTLEEKMVLENIRRNNMVFYHIIKVVTDKNTSWRL
jgi:hypothetical protein